MWRKNERETEKERDRTLTRIIRIALEMEGFEIILEGKWAKKRRKKRKRNLPDGKTA